MTIDAKTVDEYISKVPEEQNSGYFKVAGNRKK